MGKTDCKTKYCWRSVDAVLTIISRMWLGAWVWLFWTSRRLIRQKGTVSYQNQSYTINSSISECDLQYETRNAEPEIGTDKFRQSRWNPLVDGSGSRFGTPRVSGSGFWLRLEPNQPVFLLQTRTAGGLRGPVANTASTNAAWRSSFRQICYEHWPLFLWHVWHPSPQFCLYILSLI